MSVNGYQKARDASWRVLIDNKVKGLPVNVFEICKRNGIGVVSYQVGRPLLESVELWEHINNTDGFTADFDGHLVIFFDEKASISRTRFTVAHELGHIVLKHPFVSSTSGARYTIINREPSPDDDPLETEANIFASRLLAPAVVLWALGLRTPEKISDICNISLQAATIRAERMKLLYKRNIWMENPLEKQVLLQMWGFVSEQLNFFY